MDLWLGSRERSDWSIPRSVLIDESDQTELYLQLQGTGGSGVAAGDLAHAISLPCSTGGLHPCQRC